MKKENIGWRINAGNIRFDNKKPAFAGASALGGSTEASEKGSDIGIGAVGATGDAASAAGATRTTADALMPLIIHLLVQSM